MYIVADNHAFTSKRGMLKSGDEITQKDFVSKEAFDKALKKGKVIEGKSKEALAAAQKKAKAEKAVKDAKDALDANTKKCDELGNQITELVKKTQSAREALIAKEKENGEIHSLHKAVTDAQAEYTKVKKPEDQSAAAEKVARAEAAYNEKLSAVPEIKALADVIAAAEGDLAKLEKEKAEVSALIAESKKALTAAEDALKALPEVK